MSKSLVILLVQCEWFLVSKQELISSRRCISHTLGVLHKHRSSKQFSPELEQTFKSEANYNNIKKYTKYAIKHRNWHARNNDKKETPRIYFNYLLLDSRITNNLKKRALRMHQIDIWLTFLRSVFYVGKGKALRPYVHLQHAQKLLQEPDQLKLAKDPKLALIVNIWQDKRGVLLLHGFRGISSYDAHSREAAMIDALGMNHLTNRRVGVYFGLTKKHFTMGQRRLLGIALLHKLLTQFMAGEERELHPQISTCAQAA
ncbi:ankyrin repeat and LEM domain-containing protein 1 [Drosophila willistoni]|nr:ankyrin repeat and LEM domain-containing protein 1 [Drosophila willistoni]